MDPIIKGEKGELILKIFNNWNCTGTKQSEWLLITHPAELVCSNLVSVQDKSKVQSRGFHLCKKWGQKGCACVFIFIYLYIHS